ncbi:MAG: pilus assembly protein PilO [Deltaproteobacteria bacterium]|nr:MAG: pilus assembly protein PilO [Deltaproteobacteria bacterium]
MNPQIEKFLKRPLWQRLALLGAVIVLIVGAGVWFLGMPKYQELTRLKQEAQKLDGEIAQKKLVAGNLEKFKAELAKMEQQLQQALTRLPNQSEIPTLLTNLAGLAKGNGLEVESFKPGAEVPRGFFAEVPADLKLRGTYHQLALFASAVGDLPRIVNLNTLTLASPKYSGNNAVLGISCKVLTFRFVDSK